MIRRVAGRRDSGRFGTSRRRVTGSTRFRAALDRRSGRSVSRDTLARRGMYPSYISLSDHMMYLDKARIYLGVTRRLMKGTLKSGISFTITTFGTVGPDKGKGRWEKRNTNAPNAEARLAVIRNILRGEDLTFLGWEGSTRCWISRVRKNMPGSRGIAVSRPPWPCTSPISGVGSYRSTSGCGPGKRNIQGISGTLHYRICPPTSARCVLIRPPAIEFRWINWTEVFAIHG